MDVPLASPEGHGGDDETTPLTKISNQNYNDDATTVPFSRSPSIDYSKRIIAKPMFRPRKKVAEFRRKAAAAHAIQGNTSADPGGVGWFIPEGRIGVHMPVDEFDVKQLGPGIQKLLVTTVWHGGKQGWQEHSTIGHDRGVDEHYDVLRVWQRDLQQSHVVEHSLSQDNGNDTAKNTTAMLTLMEVYVFSFGACVFWNFPHAQSEQEWMDCFLFGQAHACGVRHKVGAANHAADEAAFVYGEQSTFKFDVAELATRESGEKLAVSFALAKSSLLSIYEWRLQRTIERNSHIPEELAKKGKIDMSRVEISKEVGRIFLVKHGINLDSSLSDTPEEFWEDDRFEGVYQKCSNYLEIRKRLELVNVRLSMIKDLHDVLIEAAESKHAEYLEWIIIILIVAEVVLDLLHLGFY